MSKSKSQREEVLLLKDHEHGGKKCRAGAKIRVNAAEKAWLQAHHVIAPDSPALAASTSKAKGEGVSNVTE